MQRLLDHLTTTGAPRWPALLIWAAVWLLLLALDPWVDLATLSLLLLAGSVAASLWLSPLPSVAASTVAVIAFNWLFVSPRGSFHVDRPQDLLMLVTMAAVNGLIALLMDLQRRAAIRSNDQRIRNTLLMSVSHDFRTPLSVIIATAGRLRQCEAGTDASSLQMVETIHAQASRLNHIVDNVLQLVKLDADAVRLRQDWESAQELVGNAVQLSRQRAPTRVISASVGSGLPLLWCDAVLVVQLLENLIDNALKYSPDDQPVDVSAQYVGRSVCFSVEDRGPGIAIGVADQIAENFRHGGASWAALATDGPGSGIGLALCQQIARLHDGRLEITPRDGGGSTFSFFMPLRENLALPAEQLA